MKLRFITIVVVSVLIGLIITRAVTASAEADEIIAQADEFIKEAENESVRHLSINQDLEADYWTGDIGALCSCNDSAESEEPSKEVDYSQMDVWTLGAYLYGISPNDTTRALKLITIEGYHDSPLSYYVACCCWVRATEGYWGYGDLFSAFGEADTNYGEWMDCIEYEDWAVEYLRLCYEAPTYCRYCNGMTVPEAWIYEENGIYCWN